MTPNQSVAECARALLESVRAGWRVDGRPTVDPARLNALRLALTREAPDGAGGAGACPRCGSDDPFKRGNVTVRAIDDANSDALLASGEGYPSSHDGLRNATCRDAWHDAPPDARGYELTSVAGWINVAANAIMGEINQTTDADLSDEEDYASLRGAIEGIIERAHPAPATRAVEPEVLDKALAKAAHDVWANAHPNGVCGQDVATPYIAALGVALGYGTCYPPVAAERDEAGKSGEGGA